MCIIVYKDCGIDLPTDSVIRTCFRNNSDGAGYMYRNPDTSISIRKGFMTVDALLQSLHSIPGLKDTELVIHFRFATHGDKTPGNTHPFPVTNKIHMLRKVRATVDHALVHNGIVTGLQHRDGTLSDTMCLIKLMANESEESPYIQKILESGKFIIMDREETRYYGHFYVDEVTGIMYSNETYKPIMYYSAQGRMYDLMSMTEEDSIDEYNRLYGTQFTTMEEIEAHMELLDKCDDCVWFEELTGKCYVTAELADPNCKDCNFIKWNSFDEDREIYAKNRSNTKSMAVLNLDELDNVMAAKEQDYLRQQHLMREYVDSDV